MKSIRVSLLCLSLILGGCLVVPAPYSDQLDPIAARFSATKIGVSQAELETSLGPPTLVEPDGSTRWETRIDPLNYVSLRVWFDAQGNAHKIETTRAHGISSPNFRANAIVTRQK
ncbi:MAG: hypothetical protein ABIZ04_23095 [Opitutus sp.]